MDKIKNYVIIALFAVVGVLLLLQQCNGPKSNETPVKPDTVKVVSWDTVKTPYKVVEFKTIYKPKWDTIRDIQPGEIDQDSLFFVRTYNDSLSDSNITIHTKAKTFGMLDKLDIKYRLKVPQTIIKTESTTITNTVTETKSPKVSIFIGGEVGGSQTSFNISPYAGISIKDVSYQYRYGIIDKTHNIGIGYRIFKSKK
ncbi:MAG: hypothetical protein E6R13_07755 [Spirochaetes bacterium]|nr:MAG: hypothetical protein E6R13_07755 [Spirochaetota bacterium]